MVVVMSNYYSDKASVHKGLYNRSCPKCGSPLKVVTEEKIVSATGLINNSELMSANDMKVYKTRFVCPICRLKYTDQDLRRIEKQNKDKNR